MKNLILVFSILLVQCIAYGKADSLNTSSNMALNTLNIAPIHIGIIPGNHSAEDIKFTAAIITMGVGLAIVLGASIVRTVSTNQNTKEKSRNVQMAGLGLISLPVLITLSAPKKGKWSSSSREKKPKDFKRRHHYY